MADMLVKLYRLEPHLERYPSIANVTFRPAMPYEKSFVLGWIENRFGVRWRDEAEACFTRHPVTCVLAVRGEELLGFACYEATARGYLGPIGVGEEARNLGVGARLTLSGLVGLRNLGYAYAIIGGVGPAAFYTKICGAWEIPDSTPGIYENMLPESVGKPQDADPH